MMQDCRIVRKEDEMVRALKGISQFVERARKVGVGGNREYNPGWHTASTEKTCLPFPKLSPLGDRAQRKPRRPVREIIRAKTMPQWGNVNICVEKATTAPCRFAV